MASNRQGSRHIVVAMAALAVLVIVAGIVVTRTTAPDRTPGEITLHCDASMRAVMNEIVELFHRRSDVRVNVEYGPASELLGRLSAEPGAGDLFLPGDVHYLQQAEDQGLIGESRTVAYVTPVILVQAGNPEGIASVEDLARPGLELALADADIAATGRIAPMIFEQHGIDREDIERNVVFTAATEMELGNAVRLGRADAAIVWLPVAQHFVRVEIVPIPIEHNVIAELAVGLASDAANPQGAREFMEFLGRRGAQARLEDHRYALSIPEPGDPRFETAEAMTADPEEEEQWAAVDLYWIEVFDGDERVVPVSREIEIEAGVEEDALRILLDGPNLDEDLEGYSSAIPEGTELLSFQSVGGTATADFSNDLEPGGGSAHVMAIREQITNTLMQFDSIDDVVILIEGEEDGLQP